MYNCRIEYLNSLLLITIRSHWIVKGIEETQPAWRVAVGPPSWLAQLESLEKRISLFLNESHTECSVKIPFCAAIPTPVQWCTEGLWKHVSHVVLNVAEQVWCHFTVKHHFSVAAFITGIVLPHTKTAGLKRLAIACQATRSVSTALHAAR